MNIVTQGGERPHIAIVGAGFGGLNAALGLKGDDTEVTVIDRRNHHLFQPLLYQVATAALSPGDISYPIRAIFNNHKRTRTLLAEVKNVDLDGKKLELRGGDTLEYDYLVLAAGARYFYFGNDEWEQRAPGLKSLEDALEIRRRILLAFEKAEREPDRRKREALLTFVIVGGGPTGVELAGAIAEIATQVMKEDFRAIDPKDARVILVEAGDRLLDGFAPSLSQKTEESLKKLGVWVWTNQRVSEVQQDHVYIGDRRVDSYTTLWAAGVRAVGLTASLDVPKDRAGRLIVNDDLSLPGYPDAFAIGDLAHFEEDGKVLPGIAPVAVQQGQLAAKNILRSIAGQSREAFRYFDKGNMATIGRAAAVAEVGSLKLSGPFAWLAWLFVHILYLIGFRNRLAVLINWAWAYLKMQRGARLIYGDTEKALYEKKAEEKAPEKEPASPRR